MYFKTTLLAAAAATLTLLGACDQPTGLANPRTAVEQKFAPTSSIDPATGELVALNYTPAGTVRTPGARGGPALAISPCTIEEPCDPCDPSDPYGGCYEPPCRSLITSYNEYRAGIEPYSFLEVSGTTSSSCGYLVLTGIGARINGSDDYTTLALRGRRLNPDGTWAETVDYRFGSSPSHTLEAWGEVPAGYGITGIAIGQSGMEDVRTIVLYYRQLAVTFAGVRATGPTYTARFGASPYGYTDASYVTYNDNEVFVGAGFRSIDAGERTATMAARVGQLP
ncbi:MAG TPA: hypothetical protein VFT45_02235 [Longimicrobium sp.]|nr:hypothetical protein [Longimicrobium sp.]